MAEDIAQDCLAALVHRWRRHGEPESPDAFVFAIARRRCFRALVRRRLWLPIERLGDRRDAGPDIETRLVQRSERDRMARALARLGHVDRELLLLLTVADLHVAEAAALLGISVPAVKMRAHRARRRLRDLLEDHSGADRGRNRSR